MITEKKTLREWREEAGLTQRDLGVLAGVNNGHVGRMEKGYSTLDADAGRKVLDALGVDRGQVADLAPEIRGVFVEDGYAPDAPIDTLRGWRERRCLTQDEVCLLAGFSHDYMYRIEARTVPVSTKVRMRFAAALRVAPDKIIFPGDSGTPSRAKPVEAVLRAELRGARVALRRAYDLLRDDAAITFRYQDARDRLLPDIERELKGA